MPPAQCPECGRFLSRDLVQSLATEPATCPKCGHPLTAAAFREVLGQTAGPSEEPAEAADVRAETTAEPVDGSLRPPDLAGAGAADPFDPLEGWDADPADVVELDRFRAGRQPPPDAAIVAGAGALGAVLGAVLCRRRVIGAVVGLLAGAGAAGAARQVWQLPD